MSLRLVEPSVLKSKLGHFTMEQLMHRITYAQWGPAIPGGSWIRRLCAVEPRHPRGDLEDEAVHTGAPLLKKNPHICLRNSIMSLPLVEPSVLKGKLGHFTVEQLMHRIACCKMQFSTTIGRN